MNIRIKKNECKLYQSPCRRLHNVCIHVLAAVIINDDLMVKAREIMMISLLTPFLTAKIYVVKVYMWGQKMIHFPFFRSICCYHSLLLIFNHFRSVQRVEVESIKLLLVHLIKNTSLWKFSELSY